MKTLGPNSKIEKLASQIVSKCSSIISEERLPEVMTAISDLRMAVMANSAPPAEASEGKDASDSKAAEPPARAPPRHPRSLAPVDDVSDPAAGASSKQRPGREGGSSRPSRSSSRGSADGSGLPRSDSQESHAAGASRARRRARTGDRPDVIEQRELDHLASVGPMRVRYKSPSLVPEPASAAAAGGGDSESKAPSDDPRRRRRDAPAAGGAGDPALAALHAKQRAKEEAKFQEKWTAEAGKTGKARVAAERDANIRRLDDYLEGAYEVEPAAKMDALRRLLSLARDPGTLEELVSSNTLLGALTRTLREDYKKNNELTTILMQLFYCMSHFSQLHDTLRSLHVPDLTLRVIDLEHKRAAARGADLQRLAALADAQARGDADAEDRIRAEDRDLRAAADRLGKLQRQRNKAARAARAAGGKAPEDGDEEEDEWGEGGSPTADEEDEHATGMHGRRLQRARNMAQAALKMKPLPEGRIDIVRERVRQRLLARRQEKLLFPALYLLLNLSEHVHTEKALCRRGIVGYLVPLLERPFPDLLMLVTVFLRKLSVFDENVNAMAELGAVQRLVKLLPLPPAQEVLARSTIRLLYNLSFDRELAATMAGAGLVANVAGYLAVGSMRGSVMRLLAKLSSDHGARSEIALSPAGDLVVKMALQFPQPMLPAELGCLLVNMTASAPGAQALLARRGAVGALLKRTTGSRDWILLKVLHNAAIWTHGSQASVIAEIEGDASRRVLRRLRTIRARTEAALAGIDLPALASSKLRAIAASPDDDAGSVGAVDGDEEEGGRSAVVRLEPAVVQDLVGAGQLELKNKVPEDAAPVWECFEYAAHGVWAPLLAPLLRLALRPPHEDVLPDALGILAHLTPLDLPDGGSWAVLLAQDGLLDVLSRVLDPGFAVGDIVLSAVLLVQGVALERATAPVLAQSALIGHLSGLLVECASDHEIIAQIAECVRRLAYWPETLSAMAGSGGSGDMLRRLAEFALHAKESVGAAVDAALAACIGGLRGSVGAASSGAAELADALSAKRFMRFNRQWIAAVVSEPSGHGSPSVPAEWLALSSHGGGYGMGVPQSLEHSGMSELSASDAWRGQPMHGYLDSGARTFSGPGGESQEGRLGHRLGEAVGLDIGHIGGAMDMEPASDERDLNGTGTSAPGRWEADETHDGEEGDSAEEWEGVSGTGYWDTMSTLRGAEMQGQWGTAGEDGDPSDVYTDAAAAAHK